MNAKSNYLPASDADRLVWLNNFSAKIGTHAPTVGISTAEVTSVQNDKAFFQYTINMVDVYKQNLNNLVSYKNLLKHANGQQHLGPLPTLPALGTSPTIVTEGVFDRISKIAQRIKASVNYTDSMGQDLGIIAPEYLVDPTVIQPDLKIKLDAGRPHIKCVKGIADAIDLYVDRKNGVGFIFLGRLIKMDFIDTADLPEGTVVAQWDYKAMYVIGNDNVGIMSSIESILVKKQ